VIFTSNVLEHIEDDRAVLASLRERLSPGGVLIVFVPAFMLLWTRLDDKVGHFRRYTKRELATRLEQSGLRVAQARYFDSAGFAVALLFRLAGSGDGEPSSRALALYDRYVVPASRVLDILLSRFLGKNVFAVAERSRRSA
jgi:SAM-dependent methyltransferase